MIRNREVPQLPSAVIEGILRYVPLHHRLKTCATVCKAWAAAAVSATTSMQCKVYGHVANQKLPILQNWLCLPGQQLTSLCITHTELRTRDEKPDNSAMGMLHCSGCLFPSFQGSMS
jgi:hypothetical protein